MKLTLAQQIIKDSGYDFNYPIEESHVEGLLNIMYQKAMEEQKQPFQIEKGDTETLQAKLRNALSPIYGLAEMIINSEGSDELIGMCVEQAKIAIQNTERIDSLLIAMDQKQPAMSLDECKAQIDKIIKRFNKDDYDIADVQNRVCQMLDGIYANQFREAQKWVSVDDRLPTKEGEHLVFYDNLGGMINVSWFSDNKWGYLGEGGTQKYPTHWQPLPSPPNKEG